MTVVSNGSKILIWKQITTKKCLYLLKIGCFQWFKDTNLKANHNRQCHDKSWKFVVSNGSKILIWKQITTLSWVLSSTKCCFQWFKDTNLKANHNEVEMDCIEHEVVSNGSKILIWKQITTHFCTVQFPNSCFQWFKDTNLKANHNAQYDW